MHVFYITHKNGAKARTVRWSLEDSREVAEELLSQGYRPLEGGTGWSRWSA